MPQGYACLLSSPAPIAPTGGASVQRIQTFAQITVVWSDTSTDTIANETTLLTLETSAATVGATAFVWLVVAIKGVGLALCEEPDYGNLDTLTGSATWAVVGRLQVGRFDIVQQV